MGIGRMLRWLGLASLGTMALAAIAVLGVYISMGRDLAMNFQVAGEDVDVPVEEGSVEEGQRQAQLRGCSGGCHGNSTEGRVMVELWDGTRVVAPDLARVAARYSTTDLERAIRHGVRPDGSSVIRFMPSEMFSILSDRDLGLIIAYLRSESRGEERLPEARYGPLGRIMGFMFKRQNGSVIAAEVIDHQHPAPPDTGDRAAFGRYLVRSVCSECHGNDLRGAPDGTTPSLASALAYSVEDFAALMRTGMPPDGRDLGLMANVARSRFVRFTDEEIAALHGYLQAPGTWPD